MRFFNAVLLSTVLTSNAMASGKFKTSWSFRATYESGEYFDSSETASDEPIVPWVGSTWKCSKDSVKYKNKMFYAGFTCSGTSGFVVVHISCPSTKAGQDSNATTVGDSKGYLLLSAVCITSEMIAPAPAKVTDQNL